MFERLKINCLNLMMKCLNWEKLITSEVSSPLKEILFLVAHNKIPTKERLFRVALVDDPYCESCMSELKTAVICDREHFFCSCKRVNTVWREVRNIKLIAWLLDYLLYQI